MPDTEPVTLDEAKTHCHISFSEHDNLVRQLISTAREQAEDITQRCFARQQLVLTLDRFPTDILLERPRVSQVFTLKYRDPAGTLLTLDPSNYVVDDASDIRNWIYPAPGYSWPDTWEHTNGVVVHYESGYPGDMMPYQVKRWILLAVGAMYDVTSGVDIAPMPMTAFELPPAFFSSYLEPFRVLTV
jgi:uncharacterized phiE125 gp8 family phage protein